MVISELVPAPVRVSALLDSFPEGSVNVLKAVEEITQLSEAYLEAKIVSEKWSEDTMHVAYATYFRADAIVSWNFKHIVRLDKMKAYNLVNAEYGYGALTIISPLEVDLNEEEI